MHVRCISWIKWEGKREEEEAFHWQDYRPRHDWRNWREKWNDTIHDWPPPLANWFVTASCVNDLRGTSVCRPSWEHVPSENGFNFGMARGGWEEGGRFYMEGDSSNAPSLDRLEKHRALKSFFRIGISKYWIEIPKVISYSFFFEKYEKSVDDY